MTQIATVVAVSDDGTATVSVKRASACGHDCTSCGACGIIDKPISFVAKNSIGAQVGEQVEIESETKRILAIASVVYLIPILLFFVIYCVLSFCGLKEIACILLGLLGFILGLSFAFYLNQREVRKSSVDVVIVRRIF